MKYRTFGKTGETVSIMGMGGGRLPEIEINRKKYPAQDEIDKMVEIAYKNGINYFDTAPLYCGGKCEAAIGHAVKDFRENIYIAAKINGNDVREHNFFPALEKTLCNLKTDYVDFYYFWGIGAGFFKTYIVEKGILKDAYRAKEQGLIHHVSFSFHGPTEEIREIIDTAEQNGYPMETVLVQYNFFDRVNENMLAYAKQKGLGTVVMGPAGGGRLVSSFNTAQSNGVLDIPSYEFALRFVMENTDVHCALSGMQSFDMAKENVLIPDRVCEKEGSVRTLPVRNMKLLKKFHELYCTGCKYCQPCPANIQIQDIFQFYTYFNVYGLTEHAIKQYEDYRQRGRKTYRDCMNCGQCEKRCPQKISIREELKRVDACLTRK